MATWGSGEGEKGWGKDREVSFEEGTGRDEMRCRFGRVE